MNVDVVIRKLCGDLHAEKGVGKLGNLKATIDSIVVSESDKGHPLLFQPLIQLLRVGIAVGKFEAPKKPFSRAIAESGMNMEIDFRGHVVVQYCPVSEIAYILL